RGLRLALHRQHDAGEHAARLRRPRRGGRPGPGRRRQLRAGPERVRRRRDRRRRARRPAPGGGQAELQQVLGRAARLDLLSARGRGRLMSPAGPELKQLPAWSDLQAHYETIQGEHLRDLFAADPQRGERLVAEGVGLYLDFSKNRVTDETVMLLGELAR